ncbi:MAG: asparagine synthase (glutamine-hydrolyzing) [Candidatus Binatia bacterium]
MCGITGIVSKNPLTEDQHLLRRILGKLAHRGPDDEGSYWSENAWLGVRRLSIIDLAGGHQPIHGASKKVWIVYNGEVYNFKELRAKLEGRGYRFRTNSDTEVVLAMYCEYGVSCLQHLVGMFAFAIWDSRVRQLFLARDRLGIKPLYYTVLGEKLLFASEIKSILSHPQFERRPNFEALSNYLTFRTVVGEQTVFEDIARLMPGHYALFRDGKLQIVQYWDVPVFEEKDDRGEGFYLERVSDLFRNAVKRRLISDVPLGAYLSGGLDSSLMVAVMSQLTSGPVRTFSVGFKEEGYNEFQHSRLVSQQCGTRHLEIEVPMQDYFDLLPKMIYQRDAPLSIPHEIALYLLSKALKDHVTVVLSGEGADELFGGYGRVMRSPMDYQKVAVARKLPRFLQGIFGLSFEATDFSSRLRCRDEVEHFFHVYNWLPFEDKWAIFTDDINEVIQKDEKLIECFRSYFARAARANPYDKLFYIFEKIHLVNLLDRLDMMSMAASVEARVPFVDHELVEFVSSIPVRYKLRWKSPFHQMAGLFVAADRASEWLDVSKYLLRRQAQSYLPKTITGRKKLGFPVPLDSWFRSKMGGFAREILLDERTRARGVFRVDRLEQLLNADPNLDYDFFGKRIWMLMNIELWMRGFFDKPPKVLP